MAGLGISHIYKVICLIYYVMFNFKNVNFRAVGNSNQQVSDSGYDFHDGSDDALMIDESPKKRKTVLEPFSSPKMPRKFEIKPHYCKL